ncbi:MAG: NADH-quinone oxidoreductase subunit N [Bdellovibrionales bacterium]|nr:NADH-quinone oxidoreductase subunit N [Bdellovibrionales bacterium]
MSTQFEMLDLLLVSPAIALFLASLIPLAIKVLRGNTESNSVATIMYGLVGVVTAMVLTLANYGIDKVAFQGALRFDGLSFWMQMVVLVVAAVTLILSRDNPATNNRLFSEYVFLLLNSLVGMMIVAWSNDLMSLFIGIETMSLCLYILIALSSEPRKSKEAAFKYFVLGSFASAIMLYGISFIYGTVGSTYIQDITQVSIQLMNTNRLFLFGVVLTILGLCFKVSVFPFHSWTPDVYQGAPTPLTAFMSTGVKAVSLAFFLRFIAMEVIVSERAILLMNALEWLAAFTILAGNIAAIMQDNLKRMLAYSSVAHSGYVMMGILAAGVGGESILGASGVVFYIVAYTIMTLGAFGILVLFEKRAESSLEVSDLSGLGARNPWAAACITIFMLSLAGIPPTVGFFGKLFIFSAAVKQGFFWLAVWGVIGSVISVYYYLRPIVTMYMQNDEGASVLQTKGLTRLAISVLAISVIVFGFIAESIYSTVTSDLASLFF